MKELKNVGEYGDFYRVDGTAVIYVYSDSDRLGKAILEKVQELEKKYGNDRTNFALLQKDGADDKFLTDYDLLKTPKLAMYRSGNPVGSVTQPASVESAVEEIEYLLQIFA
ncbi:hypothetical protein HYS54_00475 [Candidatus Micrarchaeota archaeon]|nr:hypothetical protein [Candidatus Micrarchaeota archaeon]